MQIQDLKYQILQQFWGYSSFKEQQEEVIDSLLSGKDTLALMPTGGGKSLCYQLPALLCEGVCLVVSPLLALMKDQVLQLQRLNISAEYISSEMEDYQLDSIYKKCKNGEVKILFISPERLINATFLYNIQDIHISFIAVDEAHCISEWGQDFRPSYQNIQRFRRDNPNLPCLALTATATPKVIDEISKKLFLKNPSIFKLSYERKNIALQVLKIEDTYHMILQILSYYKGSGLIYARTRLEVELLYQFLESKNFSNVDFFHAGLSPSEKNKKQIKWLNSNNHILICTNAFGMGINKSNVQFVIHLSPPSSIENYYQEVGRAGRNGEEVQTFLFWSEEKLTKIDDILSNQFPSKKEFASIVRAVYGLCQIADNEISKQTFQISVEHISKIVKCTQSKVKVVLNFLSTQEYIYYNTQKSASSVQLLLYPEDFYLLRNADEYFMELLLRNLPGVTHQKVFFNPKSFCEKLSISTKIFEEKMNNFHEFGYLEYTNGNVSRLNFLRPREDRKVEGEMWNLFYNIQKNKIQKWEEMKFFITNHQYCKMKLILSYFGEKTATKKCKKCSVCQQKETNMGISDISIKILEILKEREMILDEIVIRMNYYDRDSILDAIIYLREAGIIKMKDFRTYQLV